MPAKAQPVPETGYPAPVASAQIAVESPYYTIDMEFESRKRVLLYQERAKNPLLSVGLSLVIPGGGHFYRTLGSRRLLLRNTRYLHRSHPMGLLDYRD